MTDLNFLVAFVVDRVARLYEFAGQIENGRISG